jgi:hypothetical protein
MIKNNIKLSQYLFSMNFNGRSITMTYGDRAENHNGMQVIGTMANHGFTIDELKDCKRRFEDHGFVTVLYDLNTYQAPGPGPGPGPGSGPGVGLVTEPAQVLVIKRAVNCLLQNIGKTADDMFNELIAQKWDAKAFMYGRVVNKKARHNLCISDKAQKPDYENGKGTILAFKKLKCCNEIRIKLPLYLDNADNLVAEGNYYYNSDCGIGWHGDAERRKVIGIKLGDTPDLNYHWYLHGLRIGRPCQIPIEHGDIYIMSEKAVGTDWKKKTIPTLRHSTGADQYTK